MHGWRADRRLHATVGRGRNGRAGADPDGYVVPPSKLLLVDDMSVDCVIASEVFDDTEFHKFGVEATAYLRIAYPTTACPEALDSEGECPAQDYAVGTGASHGVTALFIQPGQPDRRVLSVGAGRR